MKAPTINETKLGCGTSLGDVPANATLYVVNERGDLLNVSNSKWDVLLVGESSDEGPQFCVGTERGTAPLWNCGNVFYKLDAALTAVKARCGGKP